MIYFIRNSNGHIKIGFTNRPIEARMQELQAANATPLTLIGTIDGNWRTEKFLHKSFSMYQCKNGGNEWYHPTPTMLKSIECLFV